MLLTLNSSGKILEKIHIHAILNIIYIMNITSMLELACNSQVYARICPVYIYKYINLYPLLFPVLCSHCLDLLSNKCISYLP